MYENEALVTHSLGEPSEAGSNLGSQKSDSFNMITTSLTVQENMVSNSAYEAHQPTHCQYNKIRERPVPSSGK